MNEELSKQQREYLQKRDERKERVLKILAGRGPMPVAEIAKAESISRPTMNNTIRELHREKRIYIERIETAVSTKSPFYAVGDKPDAVYKPIPKKQRAYYAKKAAEMVEEAVEREVDEIRDRRHAHWKRTWTPHPDPAAAWMMGAA